MARIYQVLMIVDQPPQQLMQQDIQQEQFEVTSRMDVFVNALFDYMIELTNSNNPQLAEELNLFIYRIPQVSKKVQQFIRSQGENSIESTAALFHVMLAGLPTELLSQVEGAIGQLFRHHVLEVVLDSLDQGRDMAATRRNFIIQVNELEQESVRGNVHTINREDLMTGEPIDYAVPYVVRQRLEAAGFDKALSLMNIDINKLSLIQLQLADLLQYSISAVASIRDYIRNNPQNTDALDNFILDSLEARYSGVNDTINPDLGYGRMTLEQALRTREDAILIKVTMGLIIRDLATHNVSLVEFINANQEEVETALRLAARLIGVWNDVGTVLLRATEPEIVDLMNAVIINNPGLGMRELLAPTDYRVKAANVTTSELVDLRAQYGGDAGLWKLLLQPLKDAANNESNLWLDLSNFSGLSDFEYRIDLLMQLNKLAKEYEHQLNSTLQLFPPVIATLIRNAVVYHAQMYQGGDYYGKKISGTTLPIIYGQLNADDYRLAQTSSNSTEIAAD